MAVVVDTGGWIDTFSKRSFMQAYKPYLADLTAVLTPAIVVYEVARYTLRVSGRDAVPEVLRYLNATEVVPFDREIAELAARLGYRHNLAAADAAIYATAVHRGVKLIAHDSDYKGLPGVVLLSR